MGLRAFLLFFWFLLVAISLFFLRLRPLAEVVLFGALIAIGLAGFLFFLWNRSRKN
jgi:hypothetical protein